MIQLWDANLICNRRDMSTELNESNSIEPTTLKRAEKEKERKLIKPVL